MPILVRGVPSKDAFGALARAPTPRLLLYGFPGTGKTTMVEEIAKFLDATLVSLTMADIQSVTPFGMEKQLQRIFLEARSKPSSIIFVDDADSLFGPRSGLPFQQHTRLVNRFLADLRSASDTNNPIVIFASDRPYEIDEAVLERLTIRAYVDLPDAEARKRILRTLLEGEPLGDDISIDAIAVSTAGYSVSELIQLVTVAAAYAEWVPFKQIVDSHTRGEVQGGIPLRKTTAAHFRQAMETVRPSRSAEVMKKMAEFCAKSGHRPVPEAK